MCRQCKLKYFLDRWTMTCIAEKVVSNPAVNSDYDLTGCIFGIYKKSDGTQYDPNGDEVKCF